MKKEKGLFLRLALLAIRKNSFIYLPYIGVCTFVLFTYFTFSMISYSDIVASLPHAAYASMLLVIGQVLLVLIVIPFLCYTNRFLIKRRKRELGLYSILGMEKGHICLLMLYETILVYLVTVAGALLLGVLFYKLMLLALLHLMGASFPVRLQISMKAVAETCIVAGATQLINLAFNLFSVGRSRPLELMGDSRKGEKDLPLGGLWSLLGLLTLGGGYWLALSARLNRHIFDSFFLAVALVVVGTYFLMTSGSVSLLHFVKRRKKWYYRPENFITVSGMLYRMKKNAAGLSNLCIFSTMVIITVACTVSVYLGLSDIQAFHYPYRIHMEFLEWNHINSIGEEMPMGEGIPMGESEVRSGEGGWPAERIEFLKWIEELAEERQIAIPDLQAYHYVGCEGLLQGDEMRSKDGSSPGQPCRLIFLPLEDFNRLSGESRELREDEILIYTSSLPYGKDRLVLGGVPFEVKEELAESTLFPKSGASDFTDTCALVMADWAKIEEAVSALETDSAPLPVLRIEMNPQGEEESILDFYEALWEAASAQEGFASCMDDQEQILNNRGMFGGLLFVGISFGLLFLLCLLVSMYYKQIAEGFEDQESFAILQKVGMDDDEVRRTIRRQVRSCFYLPMLGAVLHTAVGSHMVILLMGTINLYNKGLVLGTGAAVCILFVAVYLFCYRRTARTYYRIVKW